MVDRKGIEPFTGCLPSSPVHQRRATHQSGTGESNAVSSAPKADGSTSSLAPDWCPRRTTDAGSVACLRHLVLSTVELTRNLAPTGVGLCAWVVGIEPTTYGFGDRRSDLLSYTHMLLLKMKKPPCPVVPGAASRSRCASLAAACPAEFGVVDPSLGRGHGRTTAGHLPRRLTRRRPQHHAFNGTAASDVWQRDFATVSGWAGTCPASLGCARRVT